VIDVNRLEQLEKIAAKSKKPLPWYGLAMEYRSAGEHERSLGTFARVHELDERYVPAYFMCGQLLAELGRVDEARAELVRGMSMARTVGDAHALGEMQGLLDSLSD
jgi:tetratricopeptide (TPR) repeat protein